MGVELFMNGASVFVKKDAGLGKTISAGGYVLLGQVQRTLYVGFVINMGDLLM